MDTATTLADYWKTNAIEQFKKGATAKVSNMPALDLKVIGSLAVVAAGVLCGLVLLIR